MRILGFILLVGHVISLQFGVQYGLMATLVH